ncbi:adenylate/guanylate cyclase domain-containing protein [Nevskia sp.]|uniref:adenylate/guanylate cyclase domain-containing protein n=1 Tax=Nevskia sp. TaxID=1929292 RepID=UPI0025F1B0B5|nr:adenylate/guanylate cyclase domain-containing protein [Nevskia sp.]
MLLEIPETQFAARGDDRVAYQLLGSGPRDLVYTTGVWSHLDIFWEEPAALRSLRRLSSFARLIRFDRRGCGLSDARPLDGGSMVDHWCEDLLAVLDACASTQAVLLGSIDAGPLLLEFTHRHPTRVSGLVFVFTSACFAARPDYPQGHPAEIGETLIESVAQGWGRTEFAAAFDPSQADNPATLKWYTKLHRAMASPRAVVENLQISASLDARHILPTITVPALSFGRRDQPLFPAAQSRYIADHIDGARYIELPGADADMLWEGADEIHAAIEEFVTGKRPQVDAERALATLLFTDIVDSTKQLARLGDAVWREKLDQHDRLVREAIDEHGGRLVDAAGDGTLAMFAMPSAAIDCAQALHPALAQLGLDIRIAMHIGEVELREQGRIGGMAVHIGARVLGLAETGEVLVSRTLRDVVIGGRFEFRERGVHTLKGVPSKWPLYAVEPPSGNEEPESASLRERLRGLRR